MSSQLICGKLREDDHRCQAKVGRAQNDAFMARLEAIDTILEDADPYDVLMVCPRRPTRRQP
jgi:hypothetical protein